MGAAEGLSYLTVLGFAGAGVGARINSGGKQGLQGALAVPETLAYGALAAGLMVLASQVCWMGQGGCCWHGYCSLCWMLCPSRMSVSHGKSDRPSHAVCCVVGSVDG